MGNSSVAIVDPITATFVLTGPSTLATGQSGTYTATLYYSDGSTVVPPTPTWGHDSHLYISNPNNPATVVGQYAGSTTLTAGVYYGGVIYQSNYLSITVT